MIDMLRLLPQYSADEFDSRHRLSIVAAQRAKHILQGSRHGVSPFTKDTTIALDEVLRTAGFIRRVSYNRTWAGL